MTSNLSNYIKAVQDFYFEAANWRFLKDTEKETNNKYLKSLKEKAQLLKNEIKKMPAEDINPLLAEHIEKALSL